MITIDNPETERIARELAARSGRTVEAEVDAALRAHAASVPPPRPPQAEASPEEQARRRTILLEIQERMSRLPVLDTRAADEIPGYDENGLPT